MRKVISLSALLSGLLALPAMAVSPRDNETGRAPLVSASAQEEVEQLEAMMEAGPADVGGMKKLNRKMAAQAQEKLAQMLAAAPGGKAKSRAVR